MIFLKINFNNPLLFLSSPFSFGTGRTGLFVSLPQVLFRYAKIFVSVPVFSLSFFNASLELLSTAFVTFLLTYTYKKADRGYWLFVLFSALLPTLTGTLTSMPRYILTCFLLFPILIKRSGRISLLLIELAFIFEMILTALFIRGYWIA
jgi:hypothetical protein